MLYNFEMYNVKRKISKTKIFFCILILIIVIALSIFLAIKFAETKNNDKTIEKHEEQIDKKEIVDKKDENTKIKEEKVKTEKFTQEQVNAIENIYSSEEKRVFLTFDDGPTQSVTPLILDVLKEQNVKATFFVLGNRATANPDLIKREYNEGHYIANHGYTHIYSQIYENPQAVMDEYDYTERCIKEALQNENYNSKVFRFPGGSQGGYYSEIKDAAKEYLKENGIASLDWNSLSKDAEGVNTTEELFLNVITTVGEKQSVVILMHDAADKILTYEILPDVIQYLKENGYTFKTLYDII